MATSVAIRLAEGATITAPRMRLDLSVSSLTKPYSKSWTLLIGRVVSLMRDFLYLRFFWMRSSSFRPMVATSG